ncbi:MAG: DNA primase [Spirochaetota bacterium]
MRIPEHVITQVRERTDIADIVAEYVSLKPRGNRLWGLSPFTEEKTPSFTVTPEKGVYYCFSTNKGGNVFTFLMEMEGITFTEAVERLARRAGIEIPRNAGDQKRERGREALLELYRRVSGSFHYLLTQRQEGREAREYLASRGISEESIERFALGYAPAKPFWLHGFLRRKSYSDEFLSRSGLFTRANPARSLFTDRLMFPIYSRNGDVIAFGARLLSGEGPKYLNSPNTDIFNKSHSLYGLSQALPSIRKSGEFMLVEGYTDVIALHQAGESHAVAPLGTSFTSDQAKMLGRYAERAVLVFDSDRAGLDATRKAAILCEQHDIRPFIVTLEQGTDPADLLTDQGEEALNKLSERAISSLEYFVTIARQQNPVESPESAELVLKQLFPYIRSMSSSVRQEASLGFVADELGLHRRAIQEDFSAQTSSGSRADSRLTRQERGTPNNGTPNTRNSAEKWEETHSAELYLMLAVAVHRRFFPYVRKLIAASDLKDAWARELFVAVEEAYRAEETDLDSLFERIDDSGLVSKVAEQASRDEFGEHIAEYVEDAVRTVRRDSLLRRRHTLNARLRRSTRSQESERALLEELMALDGELQKLRVVSNDRN